MKFNFESTEEESLDAISDSLVNLALTIATASQATESYATATGHYKIKLDGTFIAPEVGVLVVTNPDHIEALNGFLKDLEGGDQRELSVIEVELQTEEVETVEEVDKTPSEKEDNDEVDKESDVS